MTDTLCQQLFLLGQLRFLAVEFSLQPLGLGLLLGEGGPCA